MQPLSCVTEALSHQMENTNATNPSTAGESDPPPPYNEIQPPPYGLSQKMHFQNGTNYGTCPTAPPPPYTPTTSRIPSTSAQRTHKNGYVPESSVTMPLNASSSTVQTEESPTQKKYAAYICCAVFLIVVMFTAYLGRSSRKYHSHYRQNYDWS